MIRVSASRWIRATRWVSSWRSASPPWRPITRATRQDWSPNAPAVVAYMFKPPRTRSPACSGTDDEERTPAARASAPTPTQRDSCPKSSTATTTPSRIAGTVAVAVLRGVHRLDQASGHRDGEDPPVADQADPGRLAPHRVADREHRQVPQHRQVGVVQGGAIDERGPLPHRRGLLRAGRPARPGWHGWGPASSSGAGRPRLAGLRQPPPRAQVTTPGPGRCLTRSGPYVANPVPAITAVLHSRRPAAAAARLTQQVGVRTRVGATRFGAGGGGSRRVLTSSSASSCSAVAALAVPGPAGRTPAPG